MIGSYDSSLKEVTTEFKSHFIEPDPVSVDTDGTQVETRDSIQARHHIYDEYKIYDISLSRVVVESLVSSSFRHEMQTRFSHNPNFDDFPGQVYSVMILDACNSSTILDIDGAENSFKDIILSDFQGENIYSLVTSTLKYVKFMERGYSLPQNPSSSLIKKETTPSCDYFNRTMYNHLDKAKDMERWYHLKDLKLLCANPDYSPYDPIGVCGIF